MFVRKLEDLRGTSFWKELCDGQARSARLLTSRDGMGFSLSDVRVASGQGTTLWYKHHWEANYIVAGRGLLTDVNRGDRWTLTPGTLYTVGPTDRHMIEPGEEMHVVSVFAPPVTGNEVHDDDGAYPPTGPVPPGREKMFVKSVDGLRERGREKIVAGGSARTVRMLLQEDQVGFTVSNVNLAAGNRNILWYRNHWEANYVLHGSGAVSDLGTDEHWPLEPGTMYCVGPEDRHSMHAHTDLHLISVFCPALNGDEQHDEHGTLSASGPIPPGPASAG